MADNKIAQFAVWDLEKLADEFREIDLGEIPPAALGFSEKDINYLLRVVPPDADEIEFLADKAVSATYYPLIIKCKTIREREELEALLPFQQHKIDAEELLKWLKTRKIID